MKIGRNDPCPCGSGRKFKACCLRRRESEESTRLRLRAVEGRIIGGTLAWIEERGGHDLFDTAWDDFAGFDESVDPDDYPELRTAFIPWLVFDWIPPRRDDWPRSTLARAYLASRPSDAGDPAFADAVARSPWSFHSVLAVEPGKGMRLRDLMTGAECDVAEASASTQAEPGWVLFGRPVSIEGVCILVGCGGLWVPPLRAFRLIDLRDELAGSSDPLSDAGVRRHAADLREAYIDFCVESRHPILPELCNTDGDPLLPTRVLFRLRCPPRLALEALAPLDLSATLEELAAGAERDERDEIRRAEISWLAHGNAKHASWENTILGTIVIDGETLELQVNSERRAAEGRKEIERRLGSDVEYRAAVHESIEEMLEERRNRPPTPREEDERRATLALNETPEVRAALAETARRHWESWLDESIPALGDITPREAATSPAGRERLELLLRSFESAPADDPFAADTAGLRRALGME